MKLADQTIIIPIVMMIARMDTNVLVNLSTV